MDHRIKDIFKMTASREKALWQNAMFVFDTSAIGDLYFLTTTAKDKMVAILEHFKDRCWIPAQVMYEYDKNREKFIKNPIEEKYKNPKFSGNCIVKEITDFVEVLKLQPYYHPILDDGQLALLEEHRYKLTVELDEMRKLIKAQFDKRKEELENVASDDAIKKIIESIQVGTPFNFAEVMQLAEEGEFRYANSIPPGYEDLERKIGTQKYGDLIIWKEIILHAKIENKPVIFICNDVQKGDMYIKDKKGNPISPRHELVREFNDETGLDFWMYTLSTFISKLQEMFGDDKLIPLFDGLDCVKYALELRTLEKGSKDSMIVCCNRCKKMLKFEEDEFCFDWEEVGWSELEMGTETEWESNEYCKCLECGNDIDFKLQVWEYPVGAINYTEIECDGATVIRPIRLDDKISVYEHETCERCGKYAVLSRDGLCDECEAEFKRFIDSDD